MTGCTGLIFAGRPWPLVEYCPRRTGTLFAVPYVEMRGGSAYLHYFVLFVGSHSYRTIYEH